MTDDGHAGDLVGAYVIDACPPDEARSVAEHASRCPACAAEIASLDRVAEWVALGTAQAPAPGLRSRVLSAALAARPAGQPSEARRLADVYAAQVAELDRLLGRLSQPQWQLPSGPHRSVRDLVAHLHDNDRSVAAVAGVDGPASAVDLRLGWHSQAGAIVRVLSDDAGGLLDREVALAGHAALRRPLREALVQRGFETWIHAEDVRAVLAEPPRTPGARQIADIVDFAARLLPGAMAAAGRAHQAGAIRLVLTGSGGSTRSIAMSALPGVEVAEITMPAERFCRLLAGRLDDPLTGARVGGDRRAAVDFLTVAATMGCD